MDADTGEIYMALEHDPPVILEEAEAVAVEFMGDYLAWTLFEARDRLKGKGKGKSKSGKGHKGKFAGKGKDQKGKSSKSAPGTFGVYGSYLGHRRALQDARNGCGFDRRPRMSVPDLMAKSRCRTCKQIGRCPLRNRQRELPRGPANTGPPSGSKGKPTTAMFFVEPPLPTSAAGYMSLTTVEPDQRAVQYMPSSEANPSNVAYFIADCLPPGPLCVMTSCRTISQRHWKCQAGLWWTVPPNMG